MQTVQLSCIKIRSISEQTKSSLHLSIFNYEYHWVRLKWFLSLWCIRRKPCTWLLLKLTLSLNEPKQDSIWHTSSRSYIRCILIDFWAYRMFHAKPCIYLASRLALSPKQTQEYQIVRPKLFLRLWCIRRKLCTYFALGLTMSTNGPKQDFIWHTSSRSSIGCIQIDF